MRKWLATVGMDGRLKVWDTKQRIDRIVDESASGQVAFGIDERIAYSQATPFESGILSKVTSVSFQQTASTCSGIQPAISTKSRRRRRVGFTSSTAIQVLRSSCSKSMPDLTCDTSHVPSTTPSIGVVTVAVLSIASRKKIYHFGAGKWTREIDSN